jgi:hypothetical protein
MMRRRLLAVGLLGLVGLMLSGCALVFAEKPAPETLTGSYVFDRNSTFLPPTDELDVTIEAGGEITARDFPAAALGHYDEGRVFDFAGTWRLLERETPFSNYRIEFVARLAESDGGDRRFVGQVSLGSGPRALSIWIDPDGDEILKLVRTPTVGVSAPPQPYSSWAGVRTR